MNRFKIANNIIGDIVLWLLNYNIQFLLYLYEFTQNHDYDYVEKIFHYGGTRLLPTVPIRNGVSNLTTRQPAYRQILTIDYCKNWGNNNVPFIL